MTQNSNSCLSEQALQQQQQRLATSSPQCGRRCRRRRSSSTWSSRSSLHWAAAVAVLVAASALVIIESSHAFVPSSTSVLLLLRLLPREVSQLRATKKGAAAATEKREPSTLQEFSLLEALGLSSSSSSSSVLSSAALTPPAPKDKEKETAESSVTNVSSNNVNGDACEDEDEKLLRHLGARSPSRKKNTEQEEFTMHVGKALDTLRRDYPKILTQQPDFSIYAKDIQVIDPSGVNVHGIAAYKNSFRLLHALVKFIYCPERSGLTFRMCYDQARENIRIHWNAQVVPRQVFGGSRTTLHVDGISVYVVDKESGDINQHRIEQLLINQNPVRPKEGVIAAMTKEHGIVVPSFCKELSGDQQCGTTSSGATTVFFQQHQQRHNLIPILVGGKLSQQQPSSLLFAVEASSTSPGSGGTGDSSADNSSSASSYPGLDWEAFEVKNKSRQKFGLEPMTPEKFLELQSQVQEMDVVQRQRAAANAAQKEQQQAAAASAANAADRRNSNPLQRLFGNVLENTCESNDECQRPEICCDLGFKKMCCASGNFVGHSDPARQRQYATVPVPVGVSDDFPQDSYGRQQY